MFNFFAKAEKPSVVSVPAPAEKDYTLTAEEQKAFDALVADENGFVRIGDVTHGLLHQQSQYISRYMDGSKSSPVLVDGLRVDVSSSTHHEYRIHLDDAIEFTARVRAFRTR